MREFFKRLPLFVLLQVPVFTALANETPYGSPSVRRAAVSKAFRLQVWGVRGFRPHSAPCKGLSAWKRTRWTATT